MNKTLPVPVSCIEDYLILANNTPKPDYYFTFSFETGNLKFFLNDVILNYQYYGFILAFFYLCLIFFIRWLMKRFEAFSLRKFSIFWNACLLIINFVACIRLFPHLLFVLRRENFFVSICADRSFIYDEVCATWLVLFPFIKILELGDTILIVLQKRYLDSYYWSHHFFALVGSWYIYPSYPAIALWICFLICTSHIPIYLYGFIRSSNILPISVFVPLLLIISEMFTVLFGAILSVVILYYQSINEYCYISLITTIILVCLFSSCFLLLNLLLYRRKKFIISNIKKKKTGTYNVNKI